MNLPGLPPLPTLKADAMRPGAAGRSTDSAEPAEGGFAAQLSRSAQGLARAQANTGTPPAAGGAPPAVKSTEPERADQAGRPGSEAAARPSAEPANTSAASAPASAPGHGAEAPEDPSRDLTRDPSADTVTNTATNTTTNTAAKGPTWPDAASLAAWVAGWTPPTSPAATVVDRPSPLARTAADRVVTADARDPAASEPLAASTDPSGADEADASAALLSTDAKLAPTVLPGAMAGTPMMLPIPLPIPLPSTQSNQVGSSSGGAGTPSLTARDSLSRSQFAVADSDGEAHPGARPADASITLPAADTLVAPAVLPGVAPANTVVMPSPVPAATRSPVGAASGDPGARSLPGRDSVMRGLPASSATGDEGTARGSLKKLPASDASGADVGRLNAPRADASARNAVSAQEPDRSPQDKQPAWTAAQSAALAVAGPVGAAPERQGSSQGAQGSFAAALDIAALAQSQGLGTAGPVGSASRSEGPVIALPTPVNSPEFREALGVQVSVLAKDGVQQAELHLNPAEMGPITVRIELDGQLAQVNFGVDNAQTRAIVEAGLPELASALREAGLTLSGGGVSEQARGQAGPGDGHAQREQAGGQRRGADSEGDPPPGKAPPQPRRVQVPGGVDLYA